MQQRALSAAIFVPPLLLVVAIGGPWIAALVLVATAVAGVEAMRLLRSAGQPVMVGLGVAVALAIVADAAVPTELVGSSAILVALAVVLAAVGAFTRMEPRDGLASWMATVFGGAYVGMLGFVVRIGNVGPDLPDGAVLAGWGSQRTWVLLLVLGVWAYDTGAYLVGRAFGRRLGELLGRERFLVHISPSKTYAGLLGGLAASTVVVLAMLGAMGQPPFHALLLGPLLGLAAQAGDLAESMLKRAAGAKDSSGLIPGHGGLLDRVDSFLFAAPVMTLYVLTFLR
jgi:phosphatidate cytidylyltransferase